MSKKIQMEINVEYGTEELKDILTKEIEKRYIDFLDAKYKNSREKGDQNIG